jgi:hypothetical protein
LIPLVEFKAHSSGSGEPHLAENVSQEAQIRQQGSGSMAEAQSHET